MAMMFIWADDAGTVRIAWDGFYTFEAHDIATNELIDEFEDEDVWDAAHAREVAEEWWAQRLADNVGKA